MRNLIFSVAASLMSAAAFAGTVVITHPGLQLQASEIKDVFTGVKQFSGSIKLIPIDNSRTQSEFLSEVIKVDANKYHSIWAKKAFQDGLTPPEAKATDVEVIEFVKRTPGAVGYVTEAPKSGVNFVK